MPTTARAAPRWHAGLPAGPAPRERLLPAAKPDPTPPDHPAPLRPPRTSDTTRATTPETTGPPPTHANHTGRLVRSTTGHQPPNTPIPSSPPVHRPAPHPTTNRTWRRSRTVDTLSRAAPGPGRPSSPQPGTNTGRGAHPVAPDHGHHAPTRHPRNTVGRPPTTPQRAPAGTDHPARRHAPARPPPNHRHRDASSAP